MTSTTPTTPTPSAPSQRQQSTVDDAKPEAISDAVLRSSFYHGLMPRQDIEPLLINNGDFLLRKTESNGNIILALAVRWNGPVKHFIVNQDKDQYYFESHHVSYRFFGF